MQNQHRKASEDISTQQSTSFDSRILKIPDESSSEFHLLGSKCKICGNIYFPQRLICPNCFRDDTLEETPLSKCGRLYSFSITRREFLAPPGFPVPYAFGYIDMPERVRVVARIKEWEPDLLRLDSKMELCIETVSMDKSGNTIIGFYFRPESDAAKAKHEENNTGRRVTGEEGSSTRSGDDRVREISTEDNRGIGCCS